MSKEPIDSYRVAGLVTTWLIHGLVFAFILAPSLFGWGRAKGHKLGGKEELIEASIAYKKPDAPKQPQKKHRTPPETEKVKISRDEKKIPDKKPEKKKKDVVPSWKDFKRDAPEENNQDYEVGKPTPRTGGAFDGETYGWADENKGHPYMRELARLVHFAIPTLEKGKGEAYACIRLGADGKIKDTKVRKSGNTNIDRAADEALRNMVKARNEDPDVKPVPHELLSLTTHWICFKPTE